MLVSLLPPLRPVFNRACLYRGKICHFIGFSPVCQSLVRGWKRGQGPRSRTPRRASAYRAPERQRGQADRGTGAAGRQYNPCTRSKGPERQRGVDPQGPGLSAVPTTRATKWAACQPPLCPGKVFEYFLYFMSKTPLCRGHSHISAGRYTTFAVGHQWATRPTYPWNRCRSTGGLAHSHRGPSHARPMVYNGAFSAVGQPAAPHITRTPSFHPRGNV